MLITNLRGTSGSGAYGFLSANGCSTSWGAIRDTLWNNGAINNLYNDGIAYCPHLSGGTTSLSITAVAGSGGAATTGYVLFWDVPNNGPLYIDSTPISVGATCSSCSGVALSPTSNSYFVLSTAIGANSFTAVGSPYTADQSFPSGLGMAHYRATIPVPSTPNWMQSSSGASTISSIVFTNHTPSIPFVVKGIGYTTYASGTSIAITFTPEQAGDELFVAGGSVAATGTCSISDGTNSYTQIDGEALGGVFLLYDFEALNVSASQVTITLTCTTTSTNRGMVVIEMRGVPHGFDQHGIDVVADGSDGSFSSASYTTTQAPELMLGWTIGSIYTIPLVSAGWIEVGEDTDGTALISKEASTTVTTTLQGFDVGATTGANTGVVRSTFY